MMHNTIASSGPHEGVSSEPWPSERSDKRSVRDRQVVLRLFDAIGDNDRDRVLSFFSEDTVFQPLGSDPMVGQDAIWRVLLGGTQGVERHIDQLAVTDNGQVRVVRTVRYRGDDGWHEERVATLFAVKGCKIARWQDAAEAS